MRRLRFREGGAVELGVRHDFFVEVSFADNKEVASRVVVRRGITGEVGIAQLEDVPVAVDADVVGDVDPPFLVLVVLLVLAQPGRDVGVVTKDGGCVVDCHAGDGVGPASCAGRTGAPGIPAQQRSRSDGRGGRGDGFW
jgi:hypothetical protein